MDGKKIKYLSRSDLISVVDKHNLLPIFKSGLNFQTISYFSFLTITNIMPGRKELVYDCWLPKTNNFIANGYILHNSIEQDADLVLMLYRQDYYSQDTESQNITDITIAKHRNGPIGNIKLIFEPETASFGNIINP